MKHHGPLRIYIAGPYTGRDYEETCKNVNNAIDAALKLWQLGHYPYIPHLTHLVDLRAKETNVKMDWEDYIEWDKSWLELCDALLFLAPSRGANIELEYAKKAGKLIFYKITDVPPRCACAIEG